MSAQAVRERPPWLQPKLFREGGPEEGGVTAKDSLSVIFERAVVPRLQTQDRRVRRRPASDPQVRRLRDTVELWDWATERPPVEAIDEATVDWWVALLPRVAWARGPWGVHYLITDVMDSGYRRYAQATITGHQERLGTLLSFLGPPCGRRLRLGLLASPPTVPPPEEPDPVPKDLWTIDECRQIAAGCERMLWHRGVRHTKAADWWRAWVALAFYTGLRTGTIADLQWGDLVERPSGWWIHVARKRASKTGKGAWIRVHKQLLAALQSIRPPVVDPAAWILERVYAREQAGKTFRNVLLPASGLPSNRQGKAHLWRAVHIEQLKRLGADLAARGGQQAAGHSSSAITDLYYADTENLLRPLLPDLWPGGLPVLLF